MVLESLDGISVKTRLARGERPGVSVTDVFALSEAFPEAGPDAPLAHDIDATARFHQRLLYNLDDSAISERARELRDVGSVSTPGTPRWIHGDFHMGQLLVGTDGTLGLVDVDRSGIGQPLDDVATFLAHAFHASRRRVRPDAVALTEHLLESAYERYGVQDVRARVSAVLLTLSTMAYARQERGWREETLQDLDVVIDWSRGSLRTWPT